MDDRETYPIGNGWYASRRRRSEHQTNDPASSNSQPVNTDQSASATHPGYESQHPSIQGQHTNRAWKPDNFPYNNSSHKSQLPGDGISQQHNKDSSHKSQHPRDEVPQQHRSRNIDVMIDALVDSLANNASSDPIDPWTRRSRRLIKAILFRILHLANKEWNKRVGNAGKSAPRPEENAKQAMREPKGRSVAADMPDHAGEDINGLRNDLYDLWDEHHALIRRVEDFEELALKRMDLFERLLLGLAARLRNSRT